MIEYFYSAHSAFAYLGSAALSEIAQQAGVGIVHKPMDLRRVVAEAKGPDFKGYGAAHNAYFFGTEIDRWAAYRRAPVTGHMPTHHANDIQLPNCLLIAAMSEGQDIGALAHVLLQAHWRDDADLADAPTLIALADSAGFDGAALIAAARTPEAEAVYARNTEEAIARSVFGSPTYFVDGEMFYGQDRLDFVQDAVKRRALR